MHLFLGFLLAFFGPLTAPLRPPGPVIEPYASEYVAKLKAYHAKRPMTSAMAISPHYPSVLRALTASDATILDWLGTARVPLFKEAVVEAKARRLPEFGRAVDDTLGDPKRPYEAQIAITELLSPHRSEPEARRVLRIGLAHPDATVRVMAGIALAPAPEARIALFAFRDLPQSYRSSSLEKEAMAALLAMGEGKDTAGLRRVLGPGGTNSRYLYPQVAQYPSGYPYLREVVADPKAYHGNRKWAMQALAKVGDHGAVPAFRAALKDRQPIVVQLAAEAAVELNDRRLVPDLRRALSNPEPIAFGPVAKALADLGATESIPDLRALLKRIDSPRLSYPTVEDALRRLEAKATGK